MKHIFRILLGASILTFALSAAYFIGHNLSPHDPGVIQAALGAMIAIAITIAITGILVLCYGIGSEFIK